MTSKKKLTIFEGPDGAGKSFAVSKLAAATGAIVTHHGPYPGMGIRELTYMYTSSMGPAARGESDVILDRCWISEPIYGAVFRGTPGGRLSEATVEVLECIAKFAEVRVVLCLPPWETCLANYLARREIEYLNDEKQLKQVYDRYAGGSLTTLPLWHLDYTRGVIPHFLTR